MATYFKFDKKIPYIKYDDIYVKSGKIENGKLILSYSNEKLDPLTIDLSAFNNLAYFDDVKLLDNMLVFSYFEKSGKRPLSVDLSYFDHFINDIELTNNKNSFKLLYNDGSFLSADVSEWNKRIEDVAVDDNVLYLSFNDMSTSISADLSQFDRRISSVNADNDILTIIDNKGDQISASLARYATDHRIKDAKLLYDGRTLVLYMNGLPDISVDTTILALNDFIRQSHLEDETLVLDYNTDKPSISVVLSALNTYVDNIAVEDGKLVLKYANDRHQPISADVNQFMQNWHLSGAKFDNETNVLSLLMNTDQLQDISVCLSSLAKDVYIKEISTDSQNDIVNFIYNDQKIAGNINLQKYKNDNDIQNAHGVHDSAIQFVKGDGSYFNVSLSSTKSIKIDDNTLSLEFNDGKATLTADLSYLDRKIVHAAVDDDNTLILTDNVDNVVSTRLPIHDTYIKYANVSDDKLILTYNDDRLPQLTASLSSIICPDTVVTSAYIDQDILSISSSNEKIVTVNLAKYNQFVTNVDFDELQNVLTIQKSNDVNFQISLDTLDKYISSIDTNGGKLTINYNNGKGTLTADLSQYDCYVNDIRFNSDVLTLKHNNDDIAADLTVDLSPLDRFNSSVTVDENNVLKITDNTNSVVSAKLPIHDTYVNAIEIDEDEDTMTFDYNVAEISAKSVNLRSYRKNDYIESGRYDSKSKNLILTYHDDPKFSQLDDLSIYLPISSGSGIISADAQLDINSENAIQNKVVTHNFNILSSIFTIDEATSSVVSFRMKDSTIPGMIWNCNVDGGQFTLSAYEPEVVVDALHTDYTHTDMLEVKD